MILCLPPLPANPLDRFMMLLRHLLLYVGKAHRPNVDMAFHTVVWWYVHGLRKRFDRLVERFRAGTLQPPRPRPSRAGRAQSEAAAPRARPRICLPRIAGWLCAHVPQHAALYGAWLRALMDDPAMIALIEAGPQAGRLLRPLFHMLGKQMPAILILPPRDRTTRAAPAPTTEREPDPVPPPLVAPPSAEGPSLAPVAPSPPRRARRRATANPPASDEQASDPGASNPGASDPGAGPPPLPGSILPA